MDRTQLDAWLAAEESEQDDAADAAFAHLFTAVPRVEPQPAFVERTVTTAFRWRTRRRRVMVVGTAAALVLVGAAAMVAYGLGPQLGAALIKGFAVASGRVVPWLVAYARVALDWWWTLGRVGSAIASAVLTPARVVALVGVELVGILAFFALHRIARAGRLGDAQV